MNFIFSIVYNMVSFERDGVHLATPFYNVVVVVIVVVVVVVVVVVCQCFSSAAKFSRSATKLFHSP